VGAVASVTFSLVSYYSCASSSTLRVAIFRGF